MGVCLLLGLASVGFPLYELGNLPDDDGPFAELWVKIKYNFDDLYYFNYFWFH